MKLYILHGGNSSGNGSVVMPATAKDVVEFCKTNPEIGRLIRTELNSIDFKKDMEQIYLGYSSLKKIPYIQAKTILDNDGTAAELYETGLFKIEEIIREIDFAIEKRKSRETVA